MGWRKFDELTGIRPAGRSHAIGRTPRRKALTATLSFLNPRMEVEFGPEVPIEQEFGLLQLPSETEGGSEFRVWAGFEVQTRDPSLRNSTLVIATYPYSTDWFDWADFKPILKRSRSELYRPLRVSQDRIRELFRSRAELPTEKFESRPGWLTARLSLPTRTEGLSITARGRLRKTAAWTAFESSLNRRGRRSRKEDSWCFGACRQFEECRAALRISEQAQWLLEKTEDGKLFGDRREKGRAPSLQVGPTVRSLGKQVLESSIVKALAGSSPKLDRIRKAGRTQLAARLMEQIYSDTIYNLAKRLANEPEAGGRVHVADLAVFAGAPETPDDTPFSKKVALYVDAFRKRPFAEDFRHVLEKLAHGRKCPGPDSRLCRRRRSSRSGPSSAAELRGALADYCRESRGAVRSSGGGQDRFEDFVQ